ncbi:hypothetical protein CN887_21040 [Bacillus pseudomycoides]|uniref:hypothetical protein n=1 Tax=Bacillus pseudomycoides TaxID=64104 RepID=UPI000BEF4331|nr:hypothetical protein [Bacillus pseudomycoides]PEJ23200.1 hypothetical protein CN887_21040 [Bacillus pseudomycoides]
MGYYVFDPETNEKIHVREWEIKYPGLDAICDVCHTDLYIRAEATSDKQPHFTHYPKRSNCPTILKNRKKYEDFKPVEIDRENAENIKKTVLANLWGTFLKCQEIMGTKLYESEFKSMIKKANDRNIWLYKGLTMTYVPYILLVNYGEFPKTDKRAKKVHFVFDAVINNFDDLWVNSKAKQKLWRVFPDEENTIETVDIEWKECRYTKPYFVNYITGIKEDALTW